MCKRECVLDCVYEREIMYKSKIIHMRESERNRVFKYT